MAKCPYAAKKKRKSLRHWKRSLCKGCVYFIEGECPLGIAGGSDTKCKAYKRQKKPKKKGFFFFLKKLLKVDD